MQSFGSEAREVQSDRSRLVNERKTGLIEIHPLKHAMSGDCQREYHLLSGYARGSTGLNKNFLSHHIAGLRWAQAGRALYEAH